MKYVNAFLTPINFVNTIMLGKLSEYPAKNNARAGPLPIPSDISDCMIGTSVRVAKYMNAPNIDAKKLENILLPPNRSFTTSSGNGFEITPAMKTHANKKGRIC